MTKIEITHAMVERAIDASWIVASASSRQQVRAMLEAALNPPPEPEITVTKEMLRAAQDAYSRYLYAASALVTSPLSFEALTAAYRAMRALEPKPVVAHDDGTVFTSRGPAHMHRRGDDTSSDTYFHRRASDPK